MGFIHETNGSTFGLEERRESFVITFGSDHEEDDVFVYDEKGLSGGIELSLERVAELQQLLLHPAIEKRLFIEKTGISREEDDFRQAMNDLRPD